MEDNFNVNLGLVTTRAESAAFAAADRIEKRFSNIKIGTTSKNSFGALNKDAANFNRTLAGVNDRFIAFAASASVIYGLSNAFKSLYANSIKVEMAMAQIQVNIRATSKELGSLESGLFSVASSTGQSFFAAADAAAEFARQGLKANKILEATNAALVLTQTTGLDTVNSVKSLTAIVNTFGEAAGSYADIVNKMAAADTSFAVSSKDLAEGVSRVGSVALDANVSFEELLATITAIQQRTSRGGNTIGNSLKSIFTRLQRDDNSTAIGNLGIETKNADGSFKNQIEVLKQLSLALNNATDTQAAQIAEMVGGVYQINIVKSLFQDLGQEVSVYSEALNTVRNAQNEAFVKSNFLSETNVSTIVKAKNAFVELSSAVGKLGLNEASKGLVGSLTEITQGATKLLKPIEGANGGDATIGEKFKDIESGVATISQSVVKGFIDALSGPGLAILIKAFAQISGSVIGKLKTDLGSSIYSNNSGSQSRLKALQEQNAAVLRITEAESRENVLLQQGNSELLKRLVIVRDIALAQSAMGLSASFAGPYRKSSPPVAPRKNFAGGFSPFSREAYDIANGVGGASKGARPVDAYIKTSPRKSEKVVLNSDEYIVKDYMGSGADAVFNKNMVRDAGGINNVRSMGDVRRAFAGGRIPTQSLARGSVPFGQRSDEELRKIIERGSNKIQVQGAIRELQKRGVNTASLRLKAPKSEVYRRNQDRPSVNLIRSNKDQEAIPLGYDPLRGVASPTSQQFLQKQAERERLIRINSEYERANRKPLEAVPAYVAPSKPSDRLSSEQKRLLHEKISNKTSYQDRINNAFSGNKPVRDQALKNAISGSSSSKKIDSLNAENQNAFIQAVQNTPNINKAKIDELASQYNVPKNSGIVKDVKKDIRSQTNSRISAKFDKYAFGAAFAGSSIGNAAGSERLGTAVSDIATFSSLGSAFGPIGIAAGALIGTFKALGSEIQSSAIPLESFSKEIEKFGAQTEKESNSIASYFSSRESLKNLTSDPNASESSISNAAQARADALISLPDKLREALIDSENSDDPKSFEKSMKLAQDSLRKTSQQSNSATAIGSLMAEAEKSNNAFGLLYRKVAFSGKDDSTLKFENKDNVKAALSSIISNIDLDSLRKQSSDLGNPQSGQAQSALSSLSRGDIGAFSRQVKGLGVVAEESRSALEKFSQNVTGKELIYFNQEVKNSFESIQKLNKIRDIEIEKSKSVAAAFSDFKVFSDNVIRKNQLSTAIDVTKSDIQSSRLGFLSDVPGLSGGARNSISTAQSLIGINEKRRSIDNSAFIESQNIFKDLFDKIGVGKLNSASGGDFVGNFLKTSEGGASNADALLSQLSEVTKKVGPGDKAILGKLQDTITEHKIENLKLTTEETLLQETLQVLQKLERKTKFDELISNLIGADSGKNVGEDIEFQRLKEDFSTVTREEQKRLNSAKNNFKNTGNASAALDLVSENRQRSQRLLDSNSERVKRGLPSLSSKIIAEAQEASIRGGNIEEFSLQSERRISEGRGTKGGAFSARAMLEARNQVILGGGSAASLIESIKILRKAANQLDPENSNKTSLESFANIIEDKILSLQNSAPNQNAINGDMMVAKELAKLNSSGNSNDNKKAGELIKAQDLIAKGQINEGKRVLLGLGYGDIANQYNNSGLDKNIKNGLNGSSGVEFGNILNGDASGAGGPIVESQERLKTSLDVLNSSIVLLNARNSVEGGISSKSSEASLIAEEKKNKSIELNRLEIERDKKIAISGEEKSNASKSLPGVLNNLNGLKSSPLESVRNSADILGRSFKNNEKVVSKDKEDSAIESIRSILDARTRLGRPNAVKEKQEFENAVSIRKKTFQENDNVPELNAKIEELSKVISQLSEKINNANQGVGDARKQGEQDIKNLEDLNPSNTNFKNIFDINLNGVDESLGDKLKPVFMDWIFQKIQENKTNPAAFDAFGKNTGIA